MVKLKYRPQFHNPIFTQCNIEHLSLSLKKKYHFWKADALGALTKKFCHA